MFSKEITKAAITCSNTKASCEKCSKLTIKISERCHWRLSAFFIINFKHISHLVLVFLLLTLNVQVPAGQGWQLQNKNFI